jgi:hypothetical protein
MNEHKAAQTPKSSASASLTPVRSGLLQRHCACGTHSSAASCSTCQNKSQPANNQGLPEDLRMQMESRFNTSFANVQIHNDNEAGQQALSAGAKAFTKGDDVYFAPGYYQPGSRKGQQLLAHELTHVVQQRNGRFSNLVASNHPAQVRSNLEEEADRMASNFGSSSTPLQVREKASTSGIYHSPLSLAEIQTLAGRGIESIADFAVQQMGNANQLVTQIQQLRTRLAGLSVLSLPPEVVAQMESLYQSLRSQAPWWLPVPNLSFAGPPQQHAGPVAIPIGIILAFLALCLAMMWVLMRSNPTIARQQDRAIRDLVDRLLRGPMPPVIIPIPVPDNPAPPQADPAPEQPRQPEREKGRKPDIEPTTDPIPPLNPSSPEIRLVLPSVKVPHLSRYTGLVRERRLIHNSDYSREVEAQADKWDKGLKPGAAEGMFQEVYDEGVNLGLSENRIFRPDWAKRPVRMPMQVDHIVELQVTPSGETGIWDSFVNYELLDQPSNSSSGSQLRNNIAAERARLVLTTGNPAWSTLPLIFTRVIPTPGPRGDRWSAEEIGRGDHIAVYRKYFKG